MEHVKIFYKCSSSKSNRNNRNRKIKCQLSNRKKMDVNDSPTSGRCLFFVVVMPSRDIVEEAMQERHRTHLVL